MSEVEKQDAVSYLYARQWQGSRLGLDRIRELLERLGNPQKKLRFVHIAGTNGKGSTAAMLASILRKAGYRTGLYTSPYIHTFHERVKVNGQAISQEDLCEFTELLRPHAQAMEDHPTEFEMVTALAFAYFADSGCDVVVLEVGLGGRLDATNVIDAPAAGIITAIGLDHTAILGDTLEKIAWEKAGIIKPGAPVVLYAKQPQAQEVVEKVCRERDAPLFLPDFDGIHRVSNTLDGQVFDYKGYSNLRLCLLGEHQLRNAAVTIEAVEVLRRRGFEIPLEAVQKGLAAARWPARFELLRREPVFLVDGGHNPQAVSAIAAALDAYLPGKKMTFVVGVMADKDYRRMFEIIAPYAQRFIAVQPENPRALPVRKLAQELMQYPVQVIAAASVSVGVRTALALAGSQDAICAFGSLYMAGAVRACLGRQG